MRQALRLASRALGETSPNPIVGAVLVKHGRVIGQGWHHRTGEPHAEIEALRDAQSKGESARGATLFVTLEPCSTEGRTPPCTRAIVDSGIRRVVVGATDAIGLHAVEKPYHFRDIHTTILHLLGLDQDALSYPHLGRRERLTLIHGRVIQEIV